MANSLLPLGAALLLLLIDSAIELALISSMVGYLHRSGANEYPFTTSSSSETILINAKPKGLLLNEGHTSNGAAGTALVGICFGGFLVLWLQRRRERRHTQRPSKVFLTYTIFTILSVLLTLAALIYVFVLTSQTDHQSISPSIAAQNQHHAYPLDEWTPGTWTKALIDLQLEKEEDRKYLRVWLRVMEGWRWNLIPMFVIGLVVVGLSVHRCLVERRVKTGSGYGAGK